MPPSQIMNKERTAANGARPYLPIQDHALIGNLRTAALISVDGSIESYCIPDFDSPSIFARILDKNKGGHFSITPKLSFTPKQAYLPASNVLRTKFLADQGVAEVVDWLPRPVDGSPARLFWMCRKVTAIRGTVPIRVECAPAFNYARDAHTAEVVHDDNVISDTQDKVVFFSQSMKMDLRYVVDASESCGAVPSVSFDLVTFKEHLGPAAVCDIKLEDGQSITFIFRILPSSVGEQNTTPGVSPSTATRVARTNFISSASKPRVTDDPLLTAEFTDRLLMETTKFWQTWIGKSTYRGSWREAVQRSALALKMLIYEPTGAIVASPTFSLPEFIGGTRNWDYRFCWIRDSSFTVYALIRLGFTEEANAYMEFIFNRLQDRNPDGSLQIMYTIHGGKQIEEIELGHLEGYKGSSPVRIGNGAADHVQLDIYGELMDCIYLGQKFSKPLGYDLWVAVRELVDFVVANRHRPDLSIWEVRNRERHFTYSKIMLWSAIFFVVHFQVLFHHRVALDRGLRLADKRSLPCPKRADWLKARDELYEEIMEKAWYAPGGHYGQSYEEPHVLDASILVAPLVFFSSAADPRFLRTLDAVLRPSERGGLVTNNLVYRYGGAQFPRPPRDADRLSPPDVTKADDGVGGEEGTFSLCTLWCVEALTRAGQYDKKYLVRAVDMFEDFLGFGNHVSLWSEEISPAGEGLGNAVQGFTHVTLISASYNLSRTLAGGQLTL
ncbi:Six-hairpin glycosidase [Dacryopinax primogenitus]|uniref:Six-hairpin glycosidase n=1 Tax=Dacryopinax primogenitus (strain DJM 731) TaxID=1858805 RepID=M5GF39_DACPD|nr:Six-hairpin glycosidase [Dacryopinax primogenitus]EJU03813.1 Six-hairpin glycosidase [Dacryopinax primogenitus]